MGVRAPEREVEAIINLYFDGIAKGCPAKKGDAASLDHANLIQSLDQDIFALER